MSRANGSGSGVLDRRVMDRGVAAMVEDKLRVPGTKRRSTYQAGQSSGAWQRSNRKAEYPEPQRTPRMNSDFSSH